MKYPITKATNVSYFRKSLKDIVDMVIKDDATLFVNRLSDTFVVLAEETYNSLVRRINELNYEIKILKSIKQVEDGDIVTKTFEELEQYE